MTELTVSTEISPAMVENRFATPVVVGVAWGPSISALRPCESSLGYRYECLQMLSHSPKAEGFGAYFMKRLPWSCS